MFRSKDPAASLFDAAMSKLSRSSSLEEQSRSNRIISVSTNAANISEGILNVGGSPPHNIPNEPPHQNANRPDGNISPPTCFSGPNSDDEMETNDSSQGSTTGRITSHISNVRLDFASRSEKIIPKRPISATVKQSNANFAMPAPIKKQKVEEQTKAEGSLSPIKPSMHKPVYRHKWTDSSEEDKTEKESNSESNKFHPSIIDNIHRQSISKPKTEMGLSLVKDALECHDTGDMQNNEDTFLYLLDTMTPKNSPRARVLTMLSLGKKFVSPDFRKFLRARNHTLKILHACHDTWKTPSLSLGTSLLIYLLARDKLSLTVDHKAMQLLTQLLKQIPISDPKNCKIDPEYAETHHNVWLLLQQWLKQMNDLVSKESIYSSTNSNNAQRSITPLRFDETTLSARFLIAESLVYISARKTDNIIKQSTIDTGLLDFVVAQIADLTRALPSTTPNNLSAELSKSQHVFTLNMLECYLRILYQISTHSEKIQSYLTNSRNAALLQACTKLLNICQHAIIELHDTEDQQIARFIDCMSVVIKVFCNLSHNNEVCNMRLSTIDGFMKLCLTCVTHVGPTAIPVHKRFDFQLLMIGLLCNLTEFSSENRRKALSLKVPFIDYDNEETTVKQVPTLVALTKMFLGHEQAAQRMDEEFDRELDLDQAPTPQEELNAHDAEDDDDEVEQRQSELSDGEIQELLKKMLGKASTHMEDSVSGAYLALLIGCLLQENEEALTVVCDVMPGGNIQPMLDQLKQLLDFMEMTSDMGVASGTKPIKRVIELLTKLNPNRSD